MQPAHGVNGARTVRPAIVGHGSESGTQLALTPLSTDCRTDSVPTRHRTASGCVARAAPQAKLENGEDSVAINSDETCGTVVLHDLQLLPTARCDQQPREIDTSDVAAVAAATPTSAAGSPDTEAVPVSAAHRHASPQLLPRSMSVVSLQAPASAWLVLAVGPSAAAASGSSPAPLACALVGGAAHSAPDTSSPSAVPQQPLCGTSAPPDPPPTARDPLPAAAPPCVPMSPASPQAAHAPIVSAFLPARDGRPPAQDRGRGRARPRGHKTPTGAAVEAAPARHSLVLPTVTSPQRALVLASATLIATRERAASFPSKALEGGAGQAAESCQAALSARPQHPQSQRQGQHVACSPGPAAGPLRAAARPSADSGALPPPSPGSGDGASSAVRGAGLGVTVVDDTAREPTAAADLAEAGDCEDGFSAERLSLFLAVDTPRRHVNAIGSNVLPSGFALSRVNAAAAAAADDGHGDCGGSAAALPRSLECSASVGRLSHALARAGTRGRKPDALPLAASALRLSPSRGPRLTGGAAKPGFAGLHDQDKFAPGQRMNALLPPTTLEENRVTASLLGVGVGVSSPLCGAAQPLAARHDTAGVPVAPHPPEHHVGSVRRATEPRPPTRLALLHDAPGSASGIAECPYSSARSGPQPAASAGVAPARATGTSGGDAPSPAVNSTHLSGDGVPGGRLAARGGVAGSEHHATAAVLPASPRLQPRVPRAAPALAPQRGMVHAAARPAVDADKPEPHTAHGRPGASRAAVAAVHRALSLADGADGCLVVLGVAAGSVSLASLGDGTHRLTEGHSGSVPASWALASEGGRSANPREATGAGVGSSPLASPAPDSRASASAPCSRSSHARPPSTAAGPWRSDYHPARGDDQTLCIDGSEAHASEVFRRVSGAAAATSPPVSGAPILAPGGSAVFPLASPSRRWGNRTYTHTAGIDSTLQLSSPRAGGSAEALSPLLLHASDSTPQSSGVSAPLALPVHSTGNLRQHEAAQGPQLAAAIPRTQLAMRRGFVPLSATAAAMHPRSLTISPPPRVSGVAAAPIAGPRAGASLSCADAHPAPAPERPGDPGSRAATPSTATSASATPASSPPLPPEMSAPSPSVRRAVSTRVPLDNTATADAAHSGLMPPSRESPVIGAWTGRPSPAPSA
jgi:hypothetical protein